MNQPIFLIGFMGSGKTTLGKALAQKLEVPFYDLDEEIEKQSGLRIKELFEQKGEPYFRSVENQCLKAFENIPAPYVLATGGGTPCFFEAMEWMMRKGKVIFLDPPFETLVERIQKTGVSRPVFLAHQNGEGKDSLHQLYLQRRKIYLQAASRLDSSTIHVNEVIHMLKN
ncbi:MAG: shikimate kinase [Bacteroidota bacterium]|nr:shikimate kinase [Bacteroidota bacterium]MDX5431025.1 shikimate kinase [Bacteroidota bacterium]MDX5469776.1 shikimate kinase [Bacteroidota bacterium]